MERSAEGLAAHCAAIVGNDQELADEIDGLLRPDHHPTWLEGSAEALRSFAGVPGALAPGGGNLEPETIAVRVGRPVIAIQGGDADLSFADSDSEVWRQRLSSRSEALRPVIASVGRVEVTNHPTGLPYMGTGWVVDERVIVTNRHVAETFAAMGPEGFRFLPGFDARHPIGVNLDFLEEFGPENQRSIRVAQVLHIAKERDPDIALLLLEPGAAAASLRPVPLATSLADIGRMVAVIGYPARDDRVPDALLMDRIFGARYDHKRLAPGFTSGYEQSWLVHDCTTLGGNSGSPIIDLATGEACGLHFSGRFLVGNYAVPAPVLARTVRDLRSPSGPITAIPMPRGLPAADAPAAAGGEAITLTIPIEVTIRVGDAQPVVALASGAHQAPPEPSLSAPSSDQVEAAVVEARRLHGQRPDVVGIVAGWKVSEGWITDQRAVIFKVRSKLPVDDLEAQGTIVLPSVVLGVPTDVWPASIDDVYPALVAEGPSSPPSYVAPADGAARLAPVHAAMSMRVGVGPDCGFSVLRDFLARTRKRLTVGMYDFTAPHVVEAVSAATSPGKRTLELTIQARGRAPSIEGCRPDLPEAEVLEGLTAAMGDRFSWTAASLSGPHRVWASSYHIKVAVRDGASFWLSSGNWQSTNQPPLDPSKGPVPGAFRSRFNREWHVVVDHPGLASTFESYLRRDGELSRAAATEEAVGPAEPLVWAPVDPRQGSSEELEAVGAILAPADFTGTVRVQPVLTPDNYADQVVELLDGAKDSLYFQIPYITVQDQVPEHFDRLLTALVAAQERVDDFRVIVGRLSPAEATLLTDRGLAVRTHVRTQGHLHNKGMVADGKVVMVGSQNWSADGTGPNRDASLIIHHQGIAQYFQSAFLSDWNRKERRIDERVAPPLYDPKDPTLRPGMEVVTLSSWRNGVL